MGFVNREVFLHRAGGLSCTGWRKLLTLSPSDDVSFLPSSIIFIHDHVFLSVNYIFRMFVLYFFRWKSKCANVNPPPHHAWRAPHEDGGVKSLLNATGSQQLVLFFLRLPTMPLFYCWMVLLSWRHRDRSVAVCVFVYSCCVGQWTCWICKWLLVSYHKSNGKRIKGQK